MKRCPECSREYDSSMMFCLDDGAELLYGPGTPSGGERPGESTTAILHSALSSSEAPTRGQVPPLLGVSRGNAGDPASAHRIASAPKISAKLLAAMIAVLLTAFAALIGYRYFTSAKSNQIGSIAVMPFINESRNSDIEFLTDGMTETLMHGLAQIPGLSVKSRSSVFRYKGIEFHPPEIGRELGVDAILVGRLIERGDQLALSVELTDVATENILWGNRYERKRSELVKLQKEVGRDVSERLKSGLSRDQEAKVTRSYTTDPEAFELYLQGRYFTNKRTPDSLNKAVEAFNGAIALDPNYALAYAGLSDAYSYQLPIEEAPKWVEYARKALEIDESVAAAHTSIANFKFFYERDYTGARREFERAIELDPNDSVTCWKYSQFLSITGSSADGIAWGRIAKELSPLDGSSGLAQSFVLSGRYDEALEETRATLQLDEKYFWSHYFGGVAYSEKGMHDEAISALERAVAVSGSLDMKGALANSLARAGRRKEAERIVEELILASKTNDASHASIAMAYVGLGDSENAFRHLYRAVESRDEEILYLKTHPMYGPLRGDERFAELLKRLNLAP